MVGDKDKDLLAKEIQSWDSFKYALREENAILFDQMLKECQDNECKEVQFANAVKAKGEPFPAESLFMTLILLQQRMISKLIQKLSNMKNPVRQKEQD
jgi:hypothetical protein